MLGPLHQLRSQLIAPAATAAPTRRSTAGRPVRLRGHAGRRNMKAMFFRFAFPVLLFSATSCNSLPKIITVPLSVRQYGESISAEGSWRKSAGTMVEPPVNTWKIACNVRTGECTLDSAEVSNLLGPYTLSLSPGQVYRVTSWKDGVLVAEPTESRTHDVTLRISITDKTVTRIWQGKGQYAEESLIETLK